MSDSDDAEFERVREQAVDALRGSDAASVYLGLVGTDVDNEYYFANDVDESDLQAVAAQQLGTLTRVLADQSDLTVEEVTAQAAEAARRMDVR